MKIENTDIKQLYDSLKMKIKEKQEVRYKNYRNGMRKNTNYKVPKGDFFFQIA